MDYMDPMSSVLQKADKLNLSLSWLLVQQLAQSDNKENIQTVYYWSAMPQLFPHLFHYDARTQDRMIAMREIFHL